MALVELFTSEGCISGPPDDAVLAEVAERARVSGVPVCALSFHVDYWNDLGWPDPFSQGFSTQRQRSTYARAPVWRSRVQGLKGKLASRSAKTVNNVLTVLNTVPKVATGWKVLDAMPCTLRLLKVSAGEVVFYVDGGETLTKKVLKDWMEKAQRAAGLEVTGGVHVLRHTFCSHLAMRGAPVRAIQALAGHSELKTTEQYMHLSPGAIESAIGLLDRGRVAQAVGNMLETEVVGS